MRQLLGSTRWRLVALQVLILAAAAITADVAIYQLTITPAQAALDGTLYDQLNTVQSALVVEGGALRPKDDRLPRDASDGTAIEATVVGQHGQVVVESSHQSLPASYRVAIAARAQADGGGIAENVSRGPLRVYAEPVTVGQAPNQVAVTIVVARSSADLQATMERLLLTLLAGTVLLVVVGGALAYTVIGRALWPVREVVALARRISERDLHQRVGVRAGGDEIKELIETFNLMLGRLEAGFTSLQSFTADASHELRAPLAVIRSQVDVALTRTRKPAEYERVLTSVLDQVERLTAIAEELLLIARADAGALRPTVTSIDVADFVHELAARWDAVAAGRHVELTVEAPAAGEVLADAVLVTRVMDNLLDNAVRHAPELSTVTVTARQEGSEWLLEVSDQGPGVAVDQRERIFERFARADSARSRAGGGAGLGLALGAAIAAAHGGRLELVDRPGAGAMFRLRLPFSVGDSKAAQSSDR